MVLHSKGSQVPPARKKMKCARHASKEILCMSPKISQACYQQCPENVPKCPKRVPYMFRTWRQNVPRISENAPNVLPNGSINLPPIEHATSQDIITHFDKLGIGDFVRLQGLRTATLNGKAGVIIDALPKTKRFAVKLDGSLTPP